MVSFRLKYAERGVFQTWVGAWYMLRAETDGYVLSTVATNALALKHQTINIHRADKIFIDLDYIGVESLI